MKRFFTRCLFVMVLTWLGTVAGLAQKSVLDESFANGQPDGWNVSAYWDFSAGNALFEGQFENRVDTLVTPLLDLSELDNQPSLAFTYSNAASSDKVNEVNIRYRASVEADWTDWLTYASATDGELSLKEALPDGLSQVQIGIFVAYKLGGDTRFYRIAVENKTEATYAPTGLKTEDLTTTSVTLWWDVCSSDKFVQYNVKVSSYPMTDMSAVADVVDNVGWMITDEFYELDNLTPNTEYWLYVQYDCGDGDVSPWAELPFRTPCASITAPYSEDFENDLSTCITIDKNGSEAAVSGEFAYNSQKAFKSNSAKGVYNYFILPEFNGNVKNYQVSFAAAALDGGETYSRTVTIGVCTEASAESFTELKTLSLPKGRQWEQIIVSLKGYAGIGKYIAFKLGNEDKENRIFIDNIRVEAASSCPKPMFVEVSEITPNSAKLKWVETGDASEWNLVVSTLPLTDPEEIDPDDTKGEYAGSVSANPYVLNGLQPNTTYFAYLQSACGSSEWTNAVEFKTSKPVLFPYTEHFDRMNPDLYTDSYLAVPDGWVMDVRNAHVGGSYFDQKPTSSTYNTFLPYVVKTQNHETTPYVSASLQIKGQSDGTGSTSANVGIAIMPAMPDGVIIKNLMVSFWALSTNGAQTIAVGVAKTQTADLAVGQQLGDNITLVNTASIAANEWKKCNVLLKDYAGDGRYIVFSVVPPTTASPTIFIDDIEIDYAPDCNPINGLAAQALGTSSAKATWSDESSATAWKVKVSSTEIDPSAADGDIANATVNAKEYTATGLAMGKTYYFYVSPACGDMWETANATTGIGLEVPYYNDFTNETAGSGKAPTGWIIGNAGGNTTNTYKPYVYNTAWSAATGTTIPADVTKPSLYFYGLYSNSTKNAYAPYAIMPELLNADVKDLKITFWGHTNQTSTSYKRSLKIGVVTSPTDLSSLTEVATVTLDAVKVSQRFSIDMSSYAGSGKYIVFYINEGTTNHTAYFMLDNLEVTLASAPQKLSDFVVSAKTQTSATFTWTENGNATKWDVRVFAAEQEDPDAGTPIWSEQVTAKTATATGLNHSTLYYAYARAVQDNGNGDWSKLSFWTETGNWALPYTEDFDSYLATSSYRTLPNYYEILQADGKTLPASNVYIYVYNFQGANFLKMQATSTAIDTVTTFAFPPFDKPLNTLEMTFQAHADAVESSTESAKQTAIDNSPTEIGVLEADGTFVPVSIFRVNSIEWEDKYVNFQTYTGTGGRIAIRCRFNKRKATNTVRLDNFLIKEMGICGRLMGVEVSEIDSTSATLSWNPIKTETAWNLKVSSSQLTDPDAQTADAFDGQVTAQTQALTGLEDNMYYYVYIQPVDAANSCVGEWSSPTKFRTLCKKQIFPYYENFDEGYETGQGKDLRCLILSGQDVNHSYVTTRGATGNKALYLRQVTKDHNNYLAFPELNVDSVKRLQLTMLVNPGSTTATNYYYYEVGVMTDPNDPSTFRSVKTDSVQGAAQTVFYEKKYTFDNYTGDALGNYGTFIALKPLHYMKPGAANYYAGYVYIDSVTIDFIETCFAPSDLMTDSIGIRGVKLKWNTDDQSAAHRVRIFDNASAKPADDTFIAETVVNSASAVLEGLNGNTTYYAYVRKECGGVNGDSKWSRLCQFKTECPEVQAIPYVDGFEQYAAQSVPNCWTALDNGTNAKCRVYETGSVVYSSVGKKGLYINYASVGSSSGNSYYQSSIVTPPLDVNNLDELLVYFDYTSISRAGGSLKIEAVADDSPSAEAIVITQINDIPTNQWKKAYLRLKDYYSSVQPYNRLRFTPTVQGTSVAIDELVITKDLNTVLPVQDLTLSMLTETSVKFSFNEPTPIVTEWQVAYVAAGGDIADAVIATINTTDHTITGLTANTSYDIYVRGNVDGDVWVGPLTAVTLQSPASIPYATGFEENADNALWNIYNVKTVQGGWYPNYFIIGDAAECDGAGSQALFVTDDNSSYAYHTYNTSASSLWATRNININAAGTYKFSFKVKVPGNKKPDNLDTDYATAHLFPAGASFKAATATMLDGSTRAGGITTDIPANNIYSLMGITYQQDEWIWVSRTLDISEAGIYSLAIYWYNASVGSLSAQPVAVDSVTVEEYLCTTPKDIEYTSRAADKVSLQWFGGQCSNFEYVLTRYANLGNPSLIEAEDKVAAGMLTEGPQVTLSGLLPATNYSFYVRTICPEGYTEWTEFDFLTPCGKYDLPYTEAFFETPECWILNAASQDKTSVGTSAEHEDWYRLQLNNGGLAILPEFNVDIKNMEVEIGLFNVTSNYGAVSLGVMDNTYDKDTYHEVAYFPTATKPANTGTYTSTQLEVFGKMLNLYQGSGKVLAIRNETSNAIGIKYITITELPDCVKPQQVELTYPSENAFTVNWIAGTEDTWEIQINDSLIENVTTNPYRINGLEQGTVYTVKVRAVCDATHTSEWSLPASIQTYCGVNPLPMTEDFSGLEKGLTSTDLRLATLTCWENKVTVGKIEDVFSGNELPFVAPLNVYAGQLWVSNWLSALGDYAQLHSYHGVYQPTYRYKWFISPQFAIEGSATLSFDARRCGNTGQKVKLDAGRFFVAVSTDNGATWKKANATEITGLDTIYTRQSLSLDKYAGQTIRVAFYDENLVGSSSPANFLLIDNVRMNCTDTYPIADNACQGVDYEDNGFFIAKEDLPIEGKDSTYYRFAANMGAGCDSTIALTLTTRKAAEIAPVYATICQGEFFQFGDRKLDKPNPVGIPYYISGETQYGCDSTIYLYLTVLPSDTLDVATPIEVYMSQLPYVVDEYYTIPAEGAAVGTFTAIAKTNECHFNRYSVTIKDISTGIISLSDEVDYIEIYDALGRKLRTLRQGDIQTAMPMGVYMLRTVMKSGSVVNNKVTMK